MTVEFLSKALHVFGSSEFYLSLPFWACFGVAVLVYRLVPEQPVLKQYVLLGVNVCMLLTIPRFTIEMLAVVLGLALFTYWVGSLLNQQVLKGARARRALAIIGIAGIVSLLIFFKYSFVQSMFFHARNSGNLNAPAFLFLIGISYSSFKALHFVFEGYKRTIQKMSLLSFMNYLLFFPGFISGPINRYQHFYDNSEMVRRSPLRADLAAGLPRIIHGLFKKIVLVTLLSPLTIQNMGVPISQMSWGQMIVGFYAVALYFYFDFSGYTDLAIGGGRIMGFILPENFNFPFLKKNIQQLWANWHMSLTSWLTDYIYWPMVRKLRNGDLLRKHPVLLSNIAIITTFALCGIWHGQTLNFLFWGLYQGVGIATVNIYQSWKRKIRLPAARRYFGSSFSYALGVFATFNFFALGQSLFVLNSEQLRTFISRLF